jgi:L-fuculose-phosphate aldolase
LQREFAHNAQIQAARKAIAEICRMMHQRGYIASRDGNVSCRIGDSRILVTPSGSRKGFLDPDDMVLCDLDARPVRGEKGKPSTESMMHVAVYRERDDVNAVVHAHPPFAIAHTVAGATLSLALMPEVYCELGEIVTIPYTTPGTEEVPERLRGPIKNHCALVMERHGSITVGASLNQAYDRLEVLEHTAKISLLANVLAPGRISGLPQEQLDKLRLFFGCGLGC